MFSNGHDMLNEPVRIIKQMDEWYGKELSALVFYFGNCLRDLLKNSYYRFASCSLHRLSWAKKYSCSLSASRS
jgi:hypothetical protein